MNLSSPEAVARQKLLKEVAEAYFTALRQKQFQAIPYDEAATLRAPLTPGGVHVPIKGKQAIYDEWWVPLEAALDGVSIHISGHYYHEDLSGIITEAEVTLKAPSVTLRVADRFTVNQDGRISEQENHFDSRAVTG